MPVMNGVEATRQITTLQKAWNMHVPVPVIGLSATVESTDDWRAAGMVYMLGKPFTRREMRNVLSMVDARRVKTYNPRVTT
jgi:CheY-like chemotaxis protein